MEEQQLSQGEFQTKPTQVKAIQWFPEMGAVFGVQMKPKKHEMNPSEFFVKTRYRGPDGKMKEVPIRPSDWVVQFMDGSYEVYEDAAFRGLYISVNGAPAPKAKEPEKESVVAAPPEPEAKGRKPKKS